jgi:quinolinate synthase
MDSLMPNGFSLKSELLRLKKQKNAIILAHYYQEDDIQEVADFIGDSLGLSQEAAATKADIIVFAGVHFMAETAKILNPSKKVLLPDLSAGCSLADSCTPEAFREFIQRHPGHAVVSYVNCGAEIKAMSDMICTSANAVDVIRSIPEGMPIIFAPDRNLGAWLQKKTGRNMILWDGACVVHEAFSLEKLTNLLESHPDAKLVAHPESKAVVLEHAHFIGSTSAMLRFIKEDPAEKFIIATEAGILRQMRIEAPLKVLIPAPSHENNSCACSECPYMKLNTLAKLYRCLKNEEPEIIVSESLRQKALLPINRMLALSARKRAPVFYA